MARRRNNGASKYVVRKAVASNLLKVGLRWRLSEVGPAGKGGVTKAVRQVGWFHDREDADFAAKCLNTFDARRSNPKRRKNSNDFWMLRHKTERDEYDDMEDYDPKHPYLYWSNDWGWGSYAGATVWSGKEKRSHTHVPKDGVWERTNHPKRRKNIMSSAAGSYDDYGSYRSQRSSKRDRNPYSKRYTLASFSKKYWGEWYDDVDRTTRMQFWDDFKYAYTGGLGRYKEETRG